MTPDLTEHVEQIKPDTAACVSLWMVNNNMHFAWFGMDDEDVLTVLERMVRHLKKENRPSLTKH